MNYPQKKTTPIGRPPAMALLRRSAPAAAKALAAAAMVAVVMGSAVWTKRAGTLPALVGFEKTSIAPNTPAIHPVSGRIMTGDTTNIATNSNPNSITSGTLNGTSAEAAPGFGVAAIEPVTETSPEYSLSTRWFDGRPVRPARVMVMRITGYSPDERSCGEFADGQTATLHSVWTNAMQLVAADPTVLPYGTMVSVPGYAGEEIVPVLDCGGAIKGARLDLLFPTHEIALEWGVKDLRVVIWEYADGRPAPNPRKVR